MPFTPSNPERVARIEAVASAIQCGKIECDVEAVCAYFDKIYNHMVQATKN